ncbi:MAG: hypothetical protein MCSN_5410 [Candidatus Microsyncoccus archaeolyticus]|nr:MAG: hypothetical protein MCSN_5410 [Candidatus Parcubacteria bacterium]
MKKYQLILLLILICIPFLASAQLKLENDYEGLDPAGSTTDLFVYFVKMAITFGVIIAVLAIMYSGINMIMAQGEMAKIILAKQRIFSVFIGLLILLGVYVISITINPDFVIIKMSDLQKIGDDIADIITGKDKDSNKIQFEEIPLGSIVESILAANSSKRIEGADDITEELCYAYDENGDTIDRNGDGKITPEEDTLRGVDMFYCMDELNQAIIKKVKALNAGYLCKGENIDGPMRTILKLIQSKDTNGNYNCRCSRCSNWQKLFFPSIPYACQTIQTYCTSCDSEGVCEEIEIDACDSNCTCCGTAYYNPDSGCQNIDNDHDPCVKEVRDQIDCARNEIKIRVDGKSYDDLPPGAKADVCAFTAFWEDPATDKEKFLTLELAKKRMESFENYYNNHLKDLNLAVNKMRDPYGERLSMVEFQTLKGRADQKEEVLSSPFTGIHGYVYDPVKYCREYNCTNTNENDICISGIRDDLTDILYEKEKEIDEFYNVPDFRDRRICKIDDEENKEKYAYSGDGATFYYKEGFKYEESYKKETLRMVTDIGEKGYMESLIPLGELVNDARNFTEKLLEFTGMVKEEVNNVETKAMEFASLPENCNCSLNCNTHPTSGGIASCNVTGPGSCPNNYCDNCSTCEGNKQGKCICCEECETITVPDSAFYYCMYSGLVTGGYTASRNAYFAFQGGINDYCPLGEVKNFNYTYPMTYENIINNEYEANYQTCYTGSSFLRIGFYSSWCSSSYSCACPGDIIPMTGYFKSKPYFYNKPEVDTPNWPFTLASCRYEGSKTIVTVAPSKTISYVACEGEEAGRLTEADKDLIEDANGGDLIWIEGEDAVDVTSFGWYGCCEMYTNTYYSSISDVVTFPSGFTGWCAVENGIHKVRFAKTGAATNSLSERGKLAKADYYVCPVNELKNKQCNIFKYSSIYDLEPYPEDLISNIDCTDPLSTGIGHLQKIDLLAKRIQNYGNGRNLKEKDPDRWTSLDILNLARKKLDQCITGYSLPLKEGAKSYTLLSCEEGIDTLSFGSAIIYPTFPYPPSDEMWNCQPYNSQKYLTEEQRTACLNNKQHPVCADAVYNLLDDYYCLQREQ